MRTFLLHLLLCASAVANAAEGMWTPEQLPEIAGPLQQAGLELDPATLTDLAAHPMGAIVSLGGCSASFVSPQGLVVTNHHCAYGAIQLNSTAERNLLRDGFSAERPADEISAGPAARVFITREIRDVTRKVLAKVTARLSDRQRHDAVDAARKALVATCETTAGQRCSVVSFFGGLTYRLFVQLEIRDVRLVYAPPEAIGGFGGEVDNWTWPRHTGDFAFYRAYVGPDGKPAAFAAENVPYRPEHHLRMARQPLQAGDFVMVAGYPGSTSRYRLADEIEAVIRWTYPQQIRRYTELMDIVDAAGPAGSDIAIKYASTMAGWGNARKNFSGQLEGFARADALGQKRREEAALTQWLQARPAGAKTLAELAALREHVSKGRATRERDLVLATLNSSGLFTAARSLHRLSVERGRADAERENGYQQRDETRIEASLRQLERRLDAGVDRQLLRHALLAYAKLPVDQRMAELDGWLQVAPGAAFGPETIDTALAALYAKTELGDTDTRLRWFAATGKDIEASSDSFLQFAITLGPALLRIENARKAHEGGLLRLLPGYLQATLDYRRSEGRATYPDANGTLRITFGKVGGVNPRDGLSYLPFTTTAGVLAKHTGVDPFDATSPQVAAIATALAVPVNFLADLDVTGGNSGSATLNSRGELVGLIFDMTWESVASNWVFNPALTRTIHVDQRYMLWIMREVYPAAALLRELGWGER